MESNRPSKTDLATAARELALLVTQTRPYNRGNAGFKAAVDRVLALTADETPARPKCPICQQEAIHVQGAFVYACACVVKRMIERGEVPRDGDV